MTEREFIDRQSELMDRMISDRNLCRKQNVIKDCIIAGIVGLVAIVFFIGYWFSDYGYNYNTTNNSNNSVESSQDVQIGGNR